MVDLKFGYVAQIYETPGAPLPRWADIRDSLHAAEAAGFDTLWFADELVWEFESLPEPIGWWECVAMAGAAAAESETIGIGTWVLSALHRNPGLTAKVAATLDEISGGKFIFGLGAGHAARQAEAFGYPMEKTVSRYEEALSIIVPLLREGSSNFTGEYHTTVNQILRPAGPSGTRIPLMLAGHGPRNMGLAVKYGDIWSAYATTSSYPKAFEEMTQRLDGIVADAGRDPASLGRSIGIGVAAPDEDPVGPFFEDSDVVRGSFDDIVAALASFTDLGVTRLEVMAASAGDDWMAAMGEVIAAVREA